MSNHIKDNLIKAYNQDASRRAGNLPDQWKVKERGYFTELLTSEGKRTLLELGAGAGNDSAHFMSHHLDVSAIDLSSEMVKVCLNKGIKANVMDFYDLDFPDEAFDSLYAMNCLLHVPKADLGIVLHEIGRVLKPNALLYIGLYGGITSEGVWEEDWCVPKRYFSFYTDEDIQSKLRQYFDILYFNTVSFEPEKPHFQSIILRKNGRLSTKGEE